jgi:hypothetical protein
LHFAGQFRETPPALPFAMASAVVGVACLHPRVRECHHFGRIVGQNEGASDEIFFGAVFRDGSKRALSREPLAK